MWLEFGFTSDGVLDPPGPHTARGWAQRVDAILAPKERTLRDPDGRLRFTRAQFLLFDKHLLQTIAAYSLPVNVGLISWGAFAGEEATLDRDVDRERLQAWLEER